MLIKNAEEVMENSKIAISHNFLMVIIRIISKSYFRASYNIVTVEGAAASRVFFHLKAEAVRMGE